MAGWAACMEEASVEEWEACTGVVAMEAAWAACTATATGYLGKSRV